MTTKMEFLMLELSRIKLEIAAERDAEFAALMLKFKFHKKFEFEESDGVREYWSTYTVFSNNEISDDLTLSEMWELELEDEETFFVWE